MRKLAQKPSNDENAVRNHENILSINNWEEEWDLSVFIQNIYSPKLRVRCLNQTWNFLAYGKVTMFMKPKEVVCLPKQVTIIFGGGR